MNLQHYTSSRQPPSMLDFVPESDEAEIRKLCAQFMASGSSNLIWEPYERWKFILLLYVPRLTFYEKLRICSKRRFKLARHCSYVRPAVGSSYHPNSRTGRRASVSHIFSRLFYSWKSDFSKSYLICRPIIALPFSTLFRSPFFSCIFTA